MSGPAVDEYAERAVLGALLLEPSVITGLVGKGLAPEHFYWEKNQNVFAAASSLAADRKTVDEITVHAELVRLGKAESTTRGQIEGLMADVPAEWNVSAYADLVMRLAAWRDRRKVGLGMAEAIKIRDEDAWEKAIAPLAAKPQKKSNVRTSFLRLVDGNTGEVVDEERRCSNCQELQDQLDGAGKEIKGWRNRYAKLERDLEEEARKDALWLVAQALFKKWQQLSGHKNSKWTPGRFYACEPYLRRHGWEMFERAVTGLTYQPYTKQRRNGTTQRFDSWESLTKSDGAFEEYANRAPKGWTSTLNLGAEQQVEESPQLAAVKEG